MSAIFLDFVRVVVDGGVEMGLSRRMHGPRPKRYEQEEIVLVKAVDESMLIAGAVYDQWYRDYFLPPSCSLSWFPPSEVEASRGVVEVLGIGHNEEVDPEKVPASIRELLKELRNQRDSGDSDRE